MDTMRKDRETTGCSTMGGVFMLYVKDSLKVLERKDIQISTFQEVIWCETTCEMEKIQIGVFYRSSSDGGF